MTHFTFGKAILFDQHGQKNDIFLYVKKDLNNGRRKSRRKG